MPRKPLNGPDKLSRVRSEVSSFIRSNHSAVRQRQPVAFIVPESSVAGRAPSWRRAKEQRDRHAFGRRRKGLVALMDSAISRYNPQGSRVVVAERSCSTTQRSTSSCGPDGRVCRTPAPFSATARASLQMTNHLTLVIDGTAVVSRNSSSPAESAEVGHRAVFFPEQGMVFHEIN